MNTLTKHDLQFIDNYLEHSNVLYADIRMEMTDHVASAIEAKMQSGDDHGFYLIFKAYMVEQKANLLNNNEQFIKNADTTILKKFGVYGFMEVVEKRQKAMNKRYLKYLWNEFKSWFTVPKIGMTLLVFLMFYMAFSFSFSDYVLVVCYGILVVWVIVMTAKLNRQFRRRKEISDKKWLLEEIIFKQAGGISLILISQLYTVTNFSEKLFESQGYIISSTLIFTLISLAVYISFHVLPKKAETLLKDTYPEFSL